MRGAGTSSRMRPGSRKLKTVAMPISGFFARHKKGFVWRLHSVARYEETGGGVYLELEVIALTRDTPASLTWVVNPVVNHLSMNSLATTLSHTHQAFNRLWAIPSQPVRVYLETRAPNLTPPLRNEIARGRR
jgi:hypothetical protein